MQVQFYMFGKHIEVIYYLWNYELLMRVNVLSFRQIQFRRDTFHVGTEIKIKSLTGTIWTNPFPP